MTPRFAFSSDKWFIVKIPVHLIIKKVRQFIICFFFTKTSFTTVTCNKLTSSAEMIDGKTTVVGTAT